MINIKPVIYKELQKVADNVTDTYQAIGKTSQSLFFWKNRTNTGDWFDDKEQKTSIRYKVDIFDNDSTSDLAIKINEIFASLGLRRIESQDIPDPLI